MTASRNKPSIPVIYAQIFLKIAIRAGLHEREILDGLGFSLPEGRLRGGLSRLSLAQYEALGQRILALGGRQGLDMAGVGYVVGLRVGMSAHGQLAHAVLSQLTVAQAITSAIRFRALVLPILQARLETGTEEAVITLALDVDLAEQLRQPLFELIAATIWRALAGLMGRARRDITLCFTHPEPDYQARFHDQLPRCRFNAEACQIRFPASYLGRRVITGDVLAAEALEESCARELALLGEQQDIAPRLRALLGSGQGYPDLTRACEQLALSPRTLKRRLQQEGTSFLALLDEAREDEATRLLRDPDLAISLIAERLGYSDPANFTNAFRRWTGVTPSAWRSHHARGERD